MTWNLIICVIAFPALGFFIKALFKTNSDMAIERHSMVLNDIEELKECLRDVKKDINNAVTSEECQTRSETKWNMINHHSHNSDGKVVVE